MPLFCWPEILCAFLHMSRTVIDRTKRFRSICNRALTQGDDDRNYGRQRPRVEGGREEEILEATVAVLAELGYDRLTMDAVATLAKASKATLYRRWSTKADLVVDAISRAKGCPIPEDVDTGSLRGDLIAMSCGDGGFTDELPMSVIAGLVTALHRDADLQKAFQERFLAPRQDDQRRGVPAGGRPRRDRTRRRHRDALGDAAGRDRAPGLHPAANSRPRT